MLRPVSSSAFSQRHCQGTASLRPSTGTSEQAVEFLHFCSFVLLVEWKQESLERFGTSLPSNSYKKRTSDKNKPSYFHHPTFWLATPRPHCRRHPTTRKLLRLPRLRVQQRSSRCAAAAEMDLGVELRMRLPPSARDASVLAHTTVLNTPRKALFYVRC